MKKTKHTPEQIIYRMREVEVLMANGSTAAQACKQIEVAELTYHRWRRDYSTIRPHSNLGYRPPAAPHT